MNYRAFAKSGSSVSEIGLGCWQLGGNWGHVDDETALSILKSIDGDAPFVATKVGRGDVYPDGYTKAAIRSRIEDSLGRLDVEALDLVQTHCVPPEIMRSGEIYEWLGQLVDEGKIRQYGASVESVAEADMLLDNCSGLYSLQIIFNLFRQKPIGAIFEKAKEK
ncbi:MAG: aldo/keto reductase, partial [Verrucomicrobiia bacterium]